MKKKYLVFSILLVLLFYFFGCVNPVVEDKDDTTIKVTGLGWYIENIDSSFWTGGTVPPSHCFYDFFIHYEGNIKLNDISYARVTVVNSGLYWSIPLTSNYFNPSNKVIGGWYRFYGNTNNVLPIGELKAEVKLKNGNKSSFTKIIPAPGSTLTNNCDYVYTPEDYTTGLVDYTPMIKRAVIGAGNTIDKTLDAMTINFSVSDSKIYNGFLFLYDSANNYTGYTKTFRDNNGNLTLMINGGTSFNLSGNNTLTVYPADITFVSGKVFDDISKFIVVLQDGNQYAIQGRYTAYDCMSISVRTSFY